MKSRFVAILILTLACAGATFIVVSQSEPVHIAGVVVPHHDMVKSARESFLQTIAKSTSPETIILIGPDHFDAGDSVASVDYREWNTINGDVIPNVYVLDGLVENGLATQDKSAFDNEHAITSVIGDIAAFFPDAKVVPIIIKRSATYSNMVDLTNQLHSQCENCLMVTSVDFSHVPPALLANLHDEISLRGLFSVDSQYLYSNAEVDSPESLAALALWAKQKGANAFELYEHTNSGFLSGNYDTEATTHIFGYYSTKNPVGIEDSLTFTIAGDTMLARGVASNDAQDGAIFESLGERFFWGVDVALVNLEGVFSKNNEIVSNEEEIPRFLFDSAYAQVIKDSNINTVMHANNHSNDGSEIDLQFTSSILESNGIEWFGGMDNDASNWVYAKEVNGIKVAFVGVYTHGEFSGVDEAIQSFSDKGYRVVVYAHWGEEYMNVHNKSQQQMAHDWADAGADMIVGTHPHVIQDIEVYKGTPVVYSLGNFVFDQNQSTEVMEGLTVSGKFTEEGLEIFLLPVTTFLQPSLIVGERKAELLKRTYETWEVFATQGDIKGTYFFPL